MAAVAAEEKTVTIRRDPHRVRRNVVRGVIVIYLLLILEGAIRKWVLPQFAEYVFFVRVPVTLGLYLYVYNAGLWPKRSRFLVYGMCFAVVGAVLIPLQMLLGGYGLRYLVLAVYGWVNYFFYIPLAFIISEQLRKEDLCRVAKKTIVLAIIAAPLTVIQLFSPANSPIVRGFGAGELQQFAGLGFGNELIRPMGFFTSSSGQQMFLVSTLAFVLGAWTTSGLQRAIPKILRIAATVAVVIMLGVSMQRGALIHSAIVVMFAILGAVFAVRTRALIFGFLYFLIFLGAGMALFVMIFPEALEMFAARWFGSFQEGSSEYEAFGQAGIFGRIVYEITKFIRLIDMVPLTGYLMGFGGNAATRIGWVELPEVWREWDGPVGFAEDGLSRNIVELGPVVGLLFIGYRFSIFVFLARKAFAVIWRTGDLLPVLLVAFVAPLLLMLQMTGQGSMVGYAWMFIGFALASIRHGYWPVRRTAHLIHEFQLPVSR